MNDITKKLLEAVTEIKGAFSGAYSIRENGRCAARASTANVSIEPKTGKPGLDIRVAPGTKGEKVYIPACVTRGGLDDLVYNDFYIGDGADVTVIAGCGVHNDDEASARHSGVHRFFLGKGAHVKYSEKHVGSGGGKGVRRIDPVTEAELAEDSLLEMETVQLGGVDSAVRSTRARAAAGARLVINERILTEGRQEAHTDFEVELNGEGSSADVVSRAVAKDFSVQSYDSRIIGNAPCAGHSECDAIIDGSARVEAAPRLTVNNAGAALIHEAAIGRIAGEQIMKLRTLGLDEKEAEARIIEGFLS